MGVNYTPHPEHPPIPRILIPTERKTALRGDTLRQRGPFTDLYGTVTPSIFDYRGKPAASARFHIRQLPMHYNSANARPLVNPNFLSNRKRSLDISLQSWIIPFGE